MGHLRRLAGVAVTLAAGEGFELQPRAALGLGAAACEASAAAGISVQRVGVSTTPGSLFHTGDVAQPRGERDGGTGSQPDACGQARTCGLAGCAGRPIYSTAAPGSG